MSASWINKLNESDSRLHKEDVIKQALEASVLGSTNAQIFLGLTKACYNPYVTFGVRKVPDTVGIIDAENPWSDFNTLLTLLSHRDLSGNAALDAINEMSERFDSNEWNTFCAPIIRRDLRAGVSEKTINKICKKTEYEIPVFGCQLATNSEGRPEMKGTKRLEPKLDGVRVLMFVIPGASEGVTTVCYSRNGKVFDNFTHIEEQISSNWIKIARGHQNALINGFVLDGEVIAHVGLVDALRPRHGEPAATFEPALKDVAARHEEFPELRRCHTDARKKVVFLQDERPNQLIFEFLAESARL